jgi:hypothetical protein
MWKKQNPLACFHCNICYVNAPQCYVIRALPDEILLLLVLIHQQSIKPSDTEDGFPDKLGMEDLLRLNTGLESLH